MQFDDTQKQQVVAWLGEGLKLAEIQTRLAGEFGVRLTYLEVKMLVSELEVLPHDPEPAPEATAPILGAAAASAVPGGSPAGRSPGAPPPPAKPPTTPPSPPAAGVSVGVDQLARPGSMVSGKVTFSDGQTGSWYVDEMGRLGLAPSQQGYRPTTADMQSFQQKLEQELSRQGM